MIGFSVKTELNRGNIRALLHFKSGMVYKDIYKRARRVQAAAKRDVGVRSGRLKRSIHIEMKSFPTVTAYVGSNVRYALMHHEGTKPHTIRAAPGRVLVFSKGGKRVMARKVLHPGTKPNRYLTSNLIRALR